MKKLIFTRILLFLLPCMVLLSAVLIYLYVLYDADIIRKPLVDYLYVAVTATIGVGVFTIIIANYIAISLMDKITTSVKKISLEKENLAEYDELMQYSVDIEQQRRALRTKIEDLSNRTDTIETITGSMQEGLVLINREGLILSANNSAHRIFGENIEKKNVMHICRDGAFQKAVKQCIAGDSAEIQIERDNRIYTVFFSPVFSNGNTRGAVVLFHDATERHRAEKQRREFSANVSHELKTPLTTISAISEMIAQGMAREEDIKTFAGRITEQSGRLLVLIDDIIRLSEFDEGRANIETTIFDLWELAENVIRTLRDNAGSVEIELTGERFDISANHRMIDELLYNLIDNGIKYNVENGKVTVELTRVEAGLCKISVSDTGIGIKEEDHPHVFERFYRADKSRSKKTGGTGLGLSIVKHITEYYNGSLELESKVGVGTTVTCFIKYQG